jgi:HSP20 family protein
VRLGLPEAQGAGIQVLTLMEYEDRYEVHAELPGLSRDDINVTLKDGTLTIEGENAEGRESQAKVKRS